MEEKTCKGTTGEAGQYLVSWNLSGVKGLSDERIVGTPEGIFKTRTTQRVPEEERWLPEGSGMVGGVPCLLDKGDDNADGEPLPSEPLRSLSEELLRETVYCFTCR